MELLLIQKSIYLYSPWKIVLCNSVVNMSNWRNGYECPQIIQIQVGYIQYHGNAWDPGKISYYYVNLALVDILECVWNSAINHF